MSLSDPFDQLSNSLARAAERAPVTRRGDRQPISDAVRSAVMRRDGNRCLYCLSRSRLVLDHIVPWSNGGSDDPTNLRTLCWDCNQQRSNRWHADTTPRPPLALICSNCDHGTTPETSAWCVCCGQVARTSETAVEHYRRRMT